jgi:hypothetical protein
MEAYKVCKSRITAVEKALEQALGTAELESSGSGPADTSSGGKAPQSDSMGEPPSYMDDLPPADFDR